MKRFGLIGFPLSHSFSKKYFTEKFEREGLSDHVYELYPLEKIEQLPGLLDSVPDLRGLNVTIPYKRAVLPYLHKTELPGNITACNCIRIDEGKLTGFNTDVTGFENSFRPLLKSHHQKALILGNGGATAAVVHVLEKCNISYKIVSRKLHQGSSLQYEDIDESIMKEYSVIINTTPVGTFPAVDECPPIPYQFISSNHYLFDLIYNPAQTLFLKKGEERGATTRNGYEMLVIQAEESWKIWNRD